MATKTVATGDLTAAADLVAPEVVSIHDIAERLGVPRVTVEKWVQRAKIPAYQEPAEVITGRTITFAFPEPWLVVANGRTSLWLYPDILNWLTDTERPIDSDGKLVVSAARRK